jgi:hypothetical protein
MIDDTNQIFPRTLSLKRPLNFLTKKEHPALKVIPTPKKVQARQNEPDDNSYRKRQPLATGCLCHDTSFEDGMWVRVGTPRIGGL